MKLVVQSAQSRRTAAMISQGVIDGVALWYERYKTRNDLRDLLTSEPDRVLADAGWTRHDLIVETNKPFWKP